MHSDLTHKWQDLHTKISINPSEDHCQDVTDSSSHHNIGHRCNRPNSTTLKHYLLLGQVTFSMRGDQKGRRSRHTCEHRLVSVRSKQFNTRKYSLTNLDYSFRACLSFNLTVAF